jgi:hypothetical protein
MLKIKWDLMIIRLFNVAVSKRIGEGKWQVIVKT